MQRLHPHLRRRVPASLVTLFGPSLLPFLLLAVLTVLRLEAAPRAIIVVGLSAGETQAARLLETAATLREAFIARGFAPEAITSLAPSPGLPLRRDAVLAALTPAPAEETWILLLGTAAPGRDGSPSFQLSGPRLSAHDFAQAVGTLPGKKFVVVATAASGGFLPPLMALPGVEAVSATAASGQINEPRFAAFWAEALTAQPGSPFAELAAAASVRVAAYYAENSLALSETALLLDRASGKILQAPFASTISAPASATPPSPAKAGLIAIEKLSVPKAKGTGEIQRLPADDESRALLSAARAAGRVTPHAAVILRTEIELVVARDLSSREIWRTRAYLRTGEALEDLGSLRLPSNPPFATATFVSARVLRPDASQLLLNPAARSARLAAEKEHPAAHPNSEPPPNYIELPEVTADCVVEAEWQIDRRSDGTLPEFYQEWGFAGPYPQLSLQLSVTVPRETRWQTYAAHFPDPLAVRETGDSTTRTWALVNLPAFENLPGDPPHRTFMPWLGVSSVSSWDAFAAWYRRLASGSDTIGPEINALAAAIAAAHPDRASRLRAAYERVASLRYVALELGVGAFRPRTPEQVWRQRYGDCKDKANLLVALLARLGIAAEFALVNRYDATFTDFPGWQFNHALARVPAAPAEGQAHDLWLDTTDRLVPFGVVAPGNLGRQALVFSRDFSSTSLQPITATQEAPPAWHERFIPDPERQEWRIELTATSSAEVHLRHLLLGLAPAARAERLRSLLATPGASVTEVRAGDPYDLAAPFTIRFTARVPAAAPPPPELIPGLAAFESRPPATYPLLWDEGRAWHYKRTGAGFENDRLIPGTRPATRP